MPISLQKFKDGLFGKKEHKRKTHPVYLLLTKTKGKAKPRAYTSKEIAKAVNMTHGAVRAVLRKLVHVDKLVVHKRPYYAIK